MCISFINFTGVLLRRTHDGNTRIMLRASGPRNGSRYNIIIRDIISAGIPVKMPLISTLTAHVSYYNSFLREKLQSTSLYNDINL